MDLSRLQQQFTMEQMMAIRPPQSQALAGMPGNAVNTGAMAPMHGRLPVGTSSGGSMNSGRMAVLPGSSAGAAMSANYGKGPATKKQKL